jgi:hypothetical protein
MFIPDIFRASYGVFLPKFIMQNMPFVACYMLGKKSCFKKCCSRIHRVLIFQCLWLLMLDEQRIWCVFATINLRQRHLYVVRYALGMAEGLVFIEIYIDIYVYVTTARPVGWWYFHFFLHKCGRMQFAILSAYSYVAISRLFCLNWTNKRRVY